MPPHHACPPQPHTPKQPHMPLSNHTCPPATMHAPHNHTCPPQPCTPPKQPGTPPATTHAPPQPCVPPTTTHPLQPCIPPATMHAPATMHTPQQPCMPPCNHACPPVNRMTNRCKNITLPQTSFAGGNNTIHQATGLAATGQNSLQRVFLPVASYTANEHFSVPQELYQLKSRNGWEL